MVLLAGLCAITAHAQRTPVKRLPVNKQAFVGWLAAEKAASQATKTFNAEEARAFLDPIDKFVSTEFRGSVRNVQFRFEAGEKKGVLRAVRDRTQRTLYEVPDSPDWTNWVDLPSAMLGRHLVIPEQRAKGFFESIQAWLTRYYGSEAMLTDVQLDFTMSPAIGIMAGKWRWQPPRRHLHLVIVIVVEA